MLGTIRQGVCKEIILERIKEYSSHKRRSRRLKDYDYSQSEVYFVTIVTHNRECLFGRIQNGKMDLNGYGRIVCDKWRNTGNIRSNIVVDDFVIMPNRNT